VNGEETEAVFPVTVTSSKNGGASVTLPYATQVDHGDTIKVEVDGVTLVEGTVNSVTKNRRQGVKVVGCNSKTSLLYEKYVLDAAHSSYTSEDAGLIAKDLVDFYMTDLISADINTATGVTISSVDFYGRTVGEAFEDLATRACCDFFVDNSNSVHFFLAGAESSGKTVTESDIFDIQGREVGQAIGKVIVECSCGTSRDYGTGLPEYYVYDRSVADSTEAAELAKALWEKLQEPTTYVEIYTYGFWDIYPRQTVIVDSPKDGYENSTETIQSTTWSFNKGAAKTVIAVGTKDYGSSPLVTVLLEQIRRLNGRRPDANLTASAHSNNHAGGGVDAHGGTNTNAHSGTGASAHTGASVSEENTHRHVLGQVWNTEVTPNGHIILYDSVGDNYVKVPCWQESTGYAYTQNVSHSHSFVEPNNHSVTNPNNHSVTQPNNHSVIQPNNHSITQPSAHASHTIC